MKFGQNLQKTHVDINKQKTTGAATFRDFSIEGFGFFHYRNSQPGTKHIFVWQKSVPNKSFCPRTVKQQKGMPHMQ